MFYIIQTVYSNNFINYFNSFCIIKHIFTNNIFSKNASLLQKFENKISSHAFPIKAIPYVRRSEVSC